MICSFLNPFLFGAAKNDDFPEIIIDSVPVPEALSDTDNLEVIKEMLIIRTKKLVAFGADYLAIACNTVHLLYPDLSVIPGANFVSMVDSVVQTAVGLNVKRVGVLATPTTIKTRLYQNKLADYGIKSYVLSPLNRQKYDIVIHSVLAHTTTPEQVDYLYQSTNKLVKKHHLDAIILGCTELPLVFPKTKFAVPILDSLEILAETLINQLNVKISS